MNIEQSAAKRAVLEKLLEQGMVLVTLDARVSGVEVPDHLARDPQLRLNLSYRFGLPMECTDEAVEATLTFSGVPFPCKLPWEAIYMFVSHTTGQPFLFPADIPEDADPLGSTSSPSKPKTEGPKLQVVASNPTAAKGDESTPPSDDDPPPAKPTSRRAHLRVVK